MSAGRQSPYVVGIEEALAEIRAGRMIILMDDEDRENEGDLCVAAERVTAEHINFMAMHGRGLICLSLTENRCDQLGLPMMVSENRAPLGTAFTVSIDARHGIGRGISAIDRATTIRTAIRSDAGPADIVSPREPEGLAGGLGRGSDFGRYVSLSPVVPPTGPGRDPPHPDAPGAVDGRRGAVASARTARGRRLANIAMRVRPPPSLHDGSHVGGPRVRATRRLPDGASPLDGVDEA